MQNLAFGGLIAWQRTQVVPNGPLHEAHQRFDPFTGALQREQHGTAMVRSSSLDNGRRAATEHLRRPGLTLTIASLLVASRMQRN